MDIQDIQIRVTYPWKLSISRGFVWICSDMSRYPYISAWSKFPDEMSASICKYLHVCVYVMMMYDDVCVCICIYLFSIACMSIDCLYEYLLFVSARMIMNLTLFVS